MQIIIDSREQIPFRFSPTIQTVRRALPVGDYSIVGCEDLVVIERKSLGDLMGSITSNRDRFVRELRHLRAFRLAVLMVEGRWMDIEGQNYRAQIHPNAVIGSLMAFTIKYGVVPILADDHETAGRITERLLLNFARMIEKEYRAIL
jgi:ERCC4-type nuclease